MRKAVSYIRYSTHNQDEKSIAYQREYIEKFCEKNDIELVGEYIDEAVSGSTDKREAFEEMIGALKSEEREWDLVVVYDLSRYSRNLVDSVNYLKEMKLHGVELVSATQHYDESNEGNFMRNITFVLNEFYSKNCSKVTHAGLTTTAIDARHCGGTPPFGYDLDDNGYLVINEEEAEVVRKIFEMYKYGYSYSKMAELLNKAGYTNKSGRPFCKNSFASILTQEKYRGVFIWNRTAAKDASGKRTSRKHKSLEEQIIIPGGCPAIVSDDLFNAVKARMNNKNCKPISARTHYMLTGMKILKCAECGSYLVGAKNNSHGKEYKVYYCPNHKNNHTCSLPQIQAAELDDFVAKLLVRELYRRDDLDEIFKCAKSSQNLRRLNDKLRGTEIAISNMTKALEANYNKFYVERLQKLAKDKKAITEKIKEESRGTQSIKMDNAKRIMRKFVKYLKTSQDVEVKKYLDENIASILVSHNDVEVTYC